MTSVYIAKVNYNLTDIDFPVSNELKEHIYSYSNFERRTQSVNAYRLLYSILGRDLKVGFASKGEPIIEGRFVSLSHTTNNVVVALSNDRVGVDIELIREKDYTTLFKKCLSTGELDFVENSTNKGEAFIKLWTKKESYLKYQGLGITKNLSNYDIDKVLKSEGLFCLTKRIENCGKVSFLSVTTKDDKVEFFIR